jgi:Cu/Ag efflux pump CusA
LREGAIAAGLTALMILLFLGSWRSTLVVMISIPLSVLSSLVVLYFLGDTLNTMTLGGLALAIGIPVDDSTVTYLVIPNPFDKISLSILKYLRGVEADQMKHYHILGNSPCLPMQ